MTTESHRPRIEPGPTTHPPGCSCGDPECPEWQATQASRRAAAGPRTYPGVGIGPAPAAGDVPRWQTLDGLAAMLEQWAEEMHAELDELNVHSPDAARASRLIFGMRVETELTFAALCVRRYLAAVADEQALAGS